MLFPKLSLKIHGVFELRAICKDSEVSLGRLFSNNLEEIENWINKFKEKANLYYGVCTRKLGSKAGKKEDCYELPGFWADLDFKDFIGGEKEAREVLNSFPLKPTVLVNSGGGLHPYWFLKDLVLLNGEISRFEAILRGIAQKVGGDSVYDISRVLRIPGTINYPTKKKRGNGRTENLPCIIEYDDGPLYNPCDFEEIELPIVADKFISSDYNFSKDLPHRFHKDLENNQMLRELWNGTRKTFVGRSSEVDRSRMDSQLTHQLVKLSYSDDEIGSILLKYEFGKTRERKNVKEYIKNTISNARSLKDYNSPSSSSLYSDNGGKKLELVDLSQVPKPGPRVDLVQGLIPKNHITILYGEGGKGKSYLALYLSYCVATGRNFLGLNTIKTSVIYLDWELDVDEHATRAHKIAKGWGLDKPQGEVNYIRIEEPFSKIIEKIKQLITQEELNFIVIDSYGASCGGNSEESSAVIDFLSQLRGLNCTILILDHQSKTQEGQKEEHKTPFGSVYKFNLGRSVIHCTNVKSDENHKELKLLLKHTKFNLGRKLNDIPIKLSFPDQEIKIELVDINTDPAFQKQITAEQKLWDAFLKIAPCTVKELSQETNAELKTTGNSLSKWKLEGKANIQGKSGKEAIYSANSLPPLTYRGNEDGNQLKEGSGTKVSEDNLNDEKYVLDNKIKGSGR